MRSAQTHCEVGEPSRFAPLSPDSEIGTTDSTDFTDFEEVIGDERTNLLEAKLQGVANCNLLYPRYVICG